MNFTLYRNCFLIGASAAMAIGPIFVLIFNRAALYGFKRGFATAFGAAIGDGILFELGFLGVLNFLEASKKFIIAMDFVIGLVLILLGIKTFLVDRKYLTDYTSGLSAYIVKKEYFIVTTMKSFFLTVINPITVLFFIFVSMKIMQTKTFTFSYFDYIFASVMIAVGSLTTFSSVALVARHLRKRLSKGQLFIASYISGVAFILLGVYFSFDFLRQLSRFFEWF